MSSGRRIVLLENGEKLGEVKEGTAPEEIAECITGQMIKLTKRRAKDQGYSAS